jgi:hypothetical protein
MTAALSGRSIASHAIPASPAQSQSVLVTVRVDSGTGTYRATAERAGTSKLGHLGKDGIEEQPRTTPVHKSVQGAVHTRRALFGLDVRLASRAGFYTAGTLGR